MPGDSTLPSTQAFVRSLNVLLKFSRLYGLDHARFATQFDLSWSELQDALATEGPSGLLLGTSGSQLLIDEIPLESAAAERSLAELLNAAGVGSIRFQPTVERGEFASLVKAFVESGPKPGSISDTLTQQFGQTANSGIIVNEIRVVAEDAAPSEARIAAQMTMQAIGMDREKAQDWFRSPEKIIQLIVAAEGEGESSAVGQFVASEAEMKGLLGLLAQLGEATHAGNPTDLDEKTWQTRFAELPQGARLTLRHTLEPLAAQRPPAELDEGTLLRIAEDVAIHFALERFQRREIGVKAVRPTLENMADEMNALRKLLKSREDKIAGAGPALELHADMLDRRFWAAAPEPDKRAALNSPEAWCIPARNVRQYMEELLLRGASEDAGNILLTYASGVKQKDPEARRKTAIGLGQLAELYGRAASEKLQDALAQSGEQLCVEKDPELQTLVSAAFVKLGQEAAQRRCYRAVQQALDCLADLEERRPTWVQGLRPRIGVENRVSDFIDEALTTAEVPEGLRGVLMRIPENSAEHLATRLSRAGKRTERERLVSLAKAAGNSCARHLAEMLKSEQPAKAAMAAGLLSRLDPMEAANFLPERLRRTGRNFHDAVVRQLAIAGAEERGRLLADSIELLDPAVLPLALDEIGMCGDGQCAPKLLRLANGDILPEADDYPRVKAIEALGRMRAPAAAGHLKQFLESRKSFGWAYPEEVRTAAAQALEKIDPEWVRENAARLGMNENVMALAPLDPAPERDVVRHRRYRRIRLPRHVPAVITSRRGKHSSAISVLSLEGGLLDGDMQLAVGTEATLKIPAGLRSINMQTVVRFVRPHQAGFEMIGMGLEDRTKLRRLLVSMGSEASPGAPGGAA